MTKSEKSVLEDIAGMLNAILAGNSDGNQPAQDEAAPADNEPSQEEIEFIKQVAAKEPFNIIGIDIRKGEGFVCDIQIGKSCLGRMFKAYLEKYDHEQRNCFKKTVGVDAQSGIWIFSLASSNCG